MKVWFPVIRGGSGADVYTRRLADALQRRGIAVEVTWFSPYFEFAPFLLRTVALPPGTDIIHVNSWNGFAFQRPGIPLIVTKHLDVLDPAYRPYKSFSQNFFHKEIIHRFEKASFHAASAITAVSQNTASSLRLSAGVQPVQVLAVTHKVRFVKKSFWTDAMIAVPVFLLCAARRPMVSGVT